MNHKKIPTSLPAKVLYFLAAVYIVIVYVLWRVNRNDLTLVVFDVGLIGTLVAIIMYPLFCTK